MWRRIVVAAIVVLALESPVAAQEQWGVNVSLTPSWQSGPGIPALFGSDRVDLHGSEVRIGVVRGIDIENDWGFSFVNTSIDAGSAVDHNVTSCSRGTCGTFVRTLDRTKMTGFEFHQYQAFKTWRDRVQVGMVGAIGLGWLRGSVYKRTVTPDSDVTTVDAKAGELYPPSTSVMPTMRLEVAGAGILAPGVKVRVSGGFGLPGYPRSGLSFIYLIPSRQ